MAYDSSFKIVMHVTKTCNESQHSTIHYDPNKNYIHIKLMKTKNFMNKSNNEKLANKKNQ